MGSSMNLSIVNLKEKLVTDCNESNLPIKVIELVLKDIYIEVCRQALLSVEQERTSQADDAG